MYSACEAMRDVLLQLGVGVDGGKDSLSMAAKVGDEMVKAPGQLVLTAYAPVPDVRRVFTPDLKREADIYADDSGKDSVLILVEFGGSEMKRRLGGSALAHVYNQTGDTSPDLDDAELFKRAFTAVQQCIGTGTGAGGATGGDVLSCHDVSDGGLLVAVLEMAFAGNCGLQLDIPSTQGSTNAFEALFAEELGCVLEIRADGVQRVKTLLTAADVPYTLLGTATFGDNMELRLAGQLLLEASVRELRDVWEETSFELDKRQALPQVVEQCKKGLKTRKAPAWNLTFDPTPPVPPAGLAEAPRIAILRQEGSNGDREMTSAFYMAGFDAFDVCVSDMLPGSKGQPPRISSLEQFQGVVFVGGFSYADVLDSGKGWAGVIRFQPAVRESFQAFVQRPDTFSLGICNGCQLMALLGWIDVEMGEAQAPAQPRFIENLSGRFESHFSSVRVEPSPAVLLKGMEGSSLGIWVAHGEGRCHLDEPAIQRALDNNLAPIRYVADDCELPTEEYPFNPNGSPRGIAALCSADGRHLAMMPHPERCVLPWQLPWAPQAWRQPDGALSAGAAPWMRLFQNAYNFCRPPTPGPTLGTALTTNATKLMLLGAGELGKEVAIEAQRFGIEVIAVDSYANINQCSSDASCTPVARHQYE